MVPDLDPGDQELVRLLRELVRQIEIGRFTDPHGHKATMNTAFLEAKAQLQLLDTLERRGERGRS